MGLAWSPLNGEVVHGNLFTHSLKTRASEIKDVLLENAFQRTVISQNAERGETPQKEGALLHSPNNGGSIPTQWWSNTVELELVLWIRNGQF